MPKSMAQGYNTLKEKKAEAAMLQVIRNIKFWSNALFLRAFRSLKYEPFSQWLNESTVSLLGMTKGMVQGYSPLKWNTVEAAMLQVILMVEIGFIWMWTMHTKAKSKGHTD